MLPLFKLVVHAFSGNNYTRNVPIFPRHKFHFRFVFCPVASWLRRFSEAASAAAGDTGRRHRSFTHTLINLIAGTKHKVFLPQPGYTICVSTISSGDLTWNAHSSGDRRLESQQLQSKSVTPAFLHSIHNPRRCIFSVAFFWLYSQLVHTGFQLR